MDPKSCAKECNVQISARAFKLIFTCKISFRYSRERALYKVCRIPSIQVRAARGAAERGRDARRRGRRRAEGRRALVPAGAKLAEVNWQNWRVLQKFCKFLAGSFSAVSKRNFARKYAFDSIFQALKDLHPFAPLQSQNFRKKIGLKKQQFS